jgi:hypothetical protein
MFYIENDINELKICPLCNEELNDPRLLPCGRTACNDCILKELEKDQENILRCEFCTETHQMPEKGFPLNQIAATLIKKKANEIHRSNTAKELKQVLKNIQSKSDNLRNRFQYAEDTIKDYCEKIRNQIQLQTAQAIDQIQEYNTELLNEVRDYEKECIKSLSSDKSYKHDLVANIERMNLFDSEWTKYLTKFEIKDSDVENALKQAKSNVNRLTIEETNLNAWLFNNRMAKFEKSEKAIEKFFTLGEIKFDEVCFLNTKFDKMEKIDLNHLVYSNITYFDCISLNKEEFVLIFLNNTFMQIYVFGKKGQILKCLNNFQNVGIRNYRAIAQNNQIIIWSYNYSNQYNVNILNKDLTNVACISIGLNIIDLTANDSNIFIYVNNNLINNYNNNLGIIRSLNKTAGNFNFPLNTTQFEANIENFYFFSDQVISIMNINSGVITKTINSFPFVQFTIIGENIVASYDKATKELFVYESDEKKYKLEVELNSDGNDLLLVKGKCPDFLFLNTSKKELFTF